MRCNKIGINFIILNQPFGNAGQQRRIAADLDLHDFIDHIITLTGGHMRGLLWVSKSTQALLAHGVYREDLAALLMGMSEHLEHARMVGGRVLTKHQYQLGLLKIL